VAIVNRPLWHCVLGVHDQVHERLLCCAGSAASAADHRQLTPHLDPSGHETPEEQPILTT
jgi:hypothetical protein